MLARLATAVGAVLLAGAATPATAGDGGGPRVGGCPVFGAANAWNRDVSRAPVDPRSAAYVRSIGAGNLHPDFASRRYGIPITVVPRGQRRVPIRFTDYGDESDKGPYPIPRGAPVEAGSDRHVIVLQRGTCKLYELFGAQRAGAGWNAASGARFDLRTGRLRPKGWTSADAAGLPMLPGLARRDEADSGVIRHALRITVPVTQRAYIHPATHWASSNTDADQPPMGLRVRLKASYDISGLRGQARVIAVALKTYGALVADNAGSPRVYVGGAVDRGWNDDDLNGIKAIPASALEAVQTGAVVRP
jgi:hypothetical protein